jgi:hypothetical protein
VHSLGVPSTKDQACANKWAKTAEKRAKKAATSERIAPIAVEVHREEVTEQAQQEEILNVSGSICRMDISNASTLTYSLSDSQASSSTHGPSQSGNNRKTVSNTGSPRRVDEMSMSFENGNSQESSIVS